MIRFALALFTLSAVTLSSHAADEDFVLAEGLEVGSAVAPGLIRHPVMATLDDRGRLFVAENAGLNLKKKELLEQRPNSIRLLTDTDADGVFDTATTFADNLTFPQGALWVYDSLYVMSPPSLWKFTDIDGDGVAEEREELVTGFDFTGNAAIVHGPFLHPNGRIYWTHGRKTYEIRDEDTGEVLESGKGARIWSSRLGGGEVEIFAGGGMDNPVEIDFTPEGEIIGTVNLFHGRPRSDTLVHWVHGGAYPRKEQTLALEGLYRTGELLPEIHDFGHIAVSGLCRYRSGSLQQEWKDQWIVSHFNTSRLTRTELRRDGAGFAAIETEEIFQVRKPDSHLTDVLEDHNGDLLVVDTGGWFRIGCPTSQIAKPEVPGNIYRISTAGAPYEAPIYSTWEPMTSEAVSGLLDADEFWLRDRAGLELAGRGDPAIPELRRILQTPESSPVAKRNAVWVLTKLRFSETADLILDALNDSDPGVRQAAAHAMSVTRTWQSVAANEPAEVAVELERNRIISGSLAAMVRSDEPQVAREAATALGRMAESRAIGALLGRLGRSGEDRFLEHSIVLALIEIDDPEATAISLDSTQPVTLRGVLRALSEMPSGNLEVLSVLPHLDAEDAGLRRTAAELATRHPEWDAALANRFFDWEEYTPPRLETMRTIVGAFASQPPFRDFLTSLVTGEDPEQHLLALDLATQAAGFKIPPTWQDQLSSFLQNPEDEALRAQTLQLLKNSPSELLLADLNALAADAVLPVSTRLQALLAFPPEDSQLDEVLFNFLVETLKTEEAGEVRNHALEVLASFRFSPRQRLTIAETASSFSPVEAPMLLDFFEELQSNEEAVAFSDSLLDLENLAGFDLRRLERIFQPFPEVLQRGLKLKIEEVQKEQETRKEKIDALLPAIDQGDAVAGKLVFESGKGSCRACHRIADLGQRLGPDLTTIGSIRSSVDLLESILYPSESIARDFQAWEVKTTNGGPTRIGVVESESETVMVVTGPGGAKHEIRHEAVESRKRIPISLMPEGLDQTMTADDLCDLVAYLLTLQ